MTQDLQPSDKKKETAKFREELMAKLGFKMDPILAKNLDVYKYFVEKQDEDFVLIVDGKVGYGKSTVSMQIAKQLDPTFCLDDVCFTPEQWHERIQYFIDNNIKRKALVFDEAMEGLSARSFATFVNRNMIRTLTKIRYLNLYHILVCYSIFDMDKPIALHRSHALIHVYKDGLQKGRFTFFNEKKKTFLYLVGKKIYSYSRPQANFYCAFPRKIPLDLDEYLKKKTNSIELLDKKKEAPNSKRLAKWKERCFIATKELLRDRTRAEVSELYGISPRFVSMMMDEASLPRDSRK